MIEEMAQQKDLYEFKKYKSEGGVRYLKWRKLEGLQMKPDYNGKLLDRKES